MKLKHALRFEGPRQAAVVGAGGKTTTIFQLARQIEGPVLVTTTTHLSVAQAAGADQHLVVAPGAQLPPLYPLELPPVTLLSGSSEDKHTTALDPVSLNALSKFAREHGLPLLIEADGARTLSLKAPAEHEPAIPEFVDTVIVLAGLSTLGQPLDEARVHRPERFATLAEMETGEQIAPEHLARVLGHLEGGLKNIPPHSRRIAVLNQVESDNLAAAAKRIGGALLPNFDAVLAASLAAQDAEQAVSAVYEPVAGVLLAAGGSDRLDEPKQLLDWKGTPFVRQVAQIGLAANLWPLVVVTGAFQEEVVAALEGMPVEIVHNTGWESGQASSVKAGLAALPPRTGAAFFLVVDQPQLPVALLEAARAEHARTLAPIIAPLVDGDRSNPVLFDRRTFPDFAALEGDIGGRAIFAKHRVVWLPWLDASLAIDVDTLEDYNRLLNYDR
jgi:molybdenum cofactor cytidylyltransferase